MCTAVKKHEESPLDTRAAAVLQTGQHKTMESQISITAWLKAVCQQSSREKPTSTHASMQLRLRSVFMFNVLETNWGPTDRVLFMQIHLVIILVWHQVATFVAYRNSLPSSLLAV